MSKHLSHSKIDRWMNETAMPEHTSVTPLILDFARGDSSSELGCAHLMMMLAGYPVPLQRITQGFDCYRKSWFIRAMMEHVDDSEWQGIAQAELKQIGKRYPHLVSRAKAAEKAWRSAGV